MVYQDDLVVAFRDIQPQAPVHVLVVPRRHIATIAELGPNHAELLGAIHGAIGQVARNLNILESGFRVVVNCGEHGQQTVHHVHYHVLGGRQFRWPPG